MTDGAVSISVKTVRKVEGDAIVNIRKGKKRIGFEMAIELVCTSKIVDGEGKNVLEDTEGEVHMPYVCEEVEDREFEVKLLKFQDARLKTVAERSLKKEVLARVHAWLEELANK